MQEKLKEDTLISNFSFPIHLKKKIRTVYSPYNQFVSDGFEFKSDFGTYTAKLSDDFKHIVKSFE